METGLPIEFSINTLTATLVVPFIYYLYQTKYWHRPDILKRGDIFLMCIAVLLATAVGLKLAEMTGAPWLKTHFALLHLIGPVLTVLIIRKTKLERWLHARGGGNQQSAQQEDSGKDKKDATTVFQPATLGKEAGGVSWDDIVINEDLKQELLATIELLKNPEEARKYGIEAPKGMLFYGPPGTGKTTIARAMASTAGLNFFALKVDDVVSKWVGESEKNLTALFAAAHKHAPSVIFFDEIDAIGRARSGKGQAWAENLLNHLLQLIDGVVKSEGVYVIGATNRVELVDAALKRAGRLNKTIEIAYPDVHARLKLFSLYLRKLQLDSAVDMNQLANVTKGCSGADIKEICNQAGLNAFKRESRAGEVKSYSVTVNDLQMALNDFTKPKTKAA